MPSPERFLAITDLSGGLNTTDPPLDVPQTQVVEAENVEWVQRKMPKKRAGCTNVSLAPWSPSGLVSVLIRHTPQGDETTSELWAFTATPAALGRYTAAGGWVAVTLLDSISGPVNSKGLSFNGKLFLLYNSSVDRMHVWDGTSLRRVGLTAPAAPSVADTGSGSYAATARYYKVSFAAISGSDIIRRSEMSTATPFTPSGSGTAARVTRPTVPGEGETHWDIWGSPDGANYFLLATEVLATTTYDDTAAPSGYELSGEVAPDVGDNTPIPSARIGIVHDARMVFARSFETTAYDSRIWFTPVLGTTDVGDDERVPSDNYLELDPGQYGPIKGLGLLFGNVIAFKWTALYKLVATGNVDAPYTVVQLSDTVGAINHKSIVSAEDENGDPAIYWLSKRGPYRMGVAGIQYIGKNVEGLWADVSLTDSYFHGVYYQDKRQIWWWLPMGTDIHASKVLVYDVRASSYSVFTGPVATARCSVMWSDTVGTTPGLTLKPHLGATTGTVVLKADSGTDDNGTKIQAWFQTAPYALAGAMTNCGVTEVQMLARADDAELEVTLTRDYGLEDVTEYVGLSAESDETHVCRKVEGLVLTSAQVVQFKVGDTQATDFTWALDGLAVRYRQEEVR